MPGEDPCDPLANPSTRAGNDDGLACHGSKHWFTLYAWVGLPPRVRRLRHDLPTGRVAITALHPFAWRVADPESEVFSFFLRDSERRSRLVLQGVAMPVELAPSKFVTAAPLPDRDCQPYQTCPEITACSIAVTSVSSPC